MDGSTNQPNHGQANFGPPYQHDHNYANHLTLSPQSGTQASTYAELGAGITSPYAGISNNGDTNNNNAMDALTAAAVAAKPSTPQSVSIASNQQTTPGQVVETGREHTGRWTKEEHDAFLTGLQMYGKEWKKVAARVKTRTVVQTRTHAQKYFQKLQRVMEQGSGADGDLSIVGGPGGITLGEASLAAMMDLGMGPSDKKGKKRPGRPSIASTQKQSKTRTPSIKRSNSSTPSEASAAALLNKISKNNERRPSGLSKVSGSGNMTTSAYSTAPLPMSGTSSQQHGFGFASSTSLSNAGLSIVAPTHDDMIQKGGFPEPSPAACGSRKMAEIAAAQMLAGVVGASVANTQPKRPSVSGTAATTAAAASTVSNGTFPSGGMEDGKATPPPAPTSTETAPAVNNSTSTFGGRGLSLQIVNPDTLTDENSRNMKKRSIPQSPITPWDGQLEALVSHVKQQEALSPSHDEAQSRKVSEENAEQSAEETTAQQLPLPLRGPHSILQSAICKGSVDEVSQICAQLAASSSIAMLNERNEAGYHPFHSAAALGLLGGFGSNSDIALNICQVLIDSGADVTCRDKEGNTPAHWAARVGHSGMLNLLLSKSCPLDAQNDEGETALHWAMRAGMRSASAVETLVENGAIVNVFNLKARRPLDVAAAGFDVDNDDNVLSKERRSTRWNLMRCSSQCRTLVLHHQECLDHLAKSAHDWEVPDRIDNIMSTLATRTVENCGPDDEENFNPHEVTVSDDFERATLELLSRIHSAEYLSFVNDLSKELERKRKQHLIEEAQSRSSDDYEPEQPMPVVPFTPMVQRKILKEERTKDNDHSDTAFSVGSLKAARRAAGAVQHAVDCVLVGRNRNAFCVVRPPGHHAGINGLLSNAESCGFCLFNNVAAGAMHALSDEKNRPRCERCAIVDIDAHHGNGTEEIVRKCHDSGRLLFFSVHLYDHDKPKKGQAFTYKFYPGTGAEDDVAHNVINVPIAPLWREKEVVKSIGLASNGLSTVVEPRQTRQRTKELSVNDLSKLASEDSTMQLKPRDGLLSQDSESVASESTSSSTKPRSQLPSSSPHYPPHYLMGTGRLAYRRAIQHRLLPALRAFNPDLIILSTGFDAARGDVGNARHYNNGTEAMGFDLEPEDYAWTARKVCEVADICCQGRVVSVLEGGYGRTPPPIPAPPLFGNAPAEEDPELIKQALDKSFFSDCAIQHLKGLVDPYCDESSKKD